jgi:small subunit ribosomal protein S16
MAVRIRLSRVGRIHRPFFRVVAIDKRCHREGVANEVLGTYDPLAAEGKNFAIKTDRVEAWLAQGAQLSDGLGSLFKHHGVAVKLPVAAAKAKKAPKAKKAAKPVGKKGEKQAWVAPTRRALRKHAAKKKAERKAQAAAAAAAAPAAEAPKA